MGLEAPLEHLTGCSEALGSDRRRPKPLNVARIDLVSIRLVLLCADLGTLSAAAEAANLSISGASHRLTKLEQSLGAALFERHRRGLHMTLAGELMVQYGRRMLVALDELAGRLGEVREGQRRSSGAKGNPHERPLFSL